MCDLRRPSPRSTQLFPSVDTQLRITFSGRRSPCGGEAGQDVAHGGKDRAVTSLGHDWGWRRLQDAHQALVFFHAMRLWAISARK